MSQSLLSRVLHKVVSVTGGAPSFVSRPPTGDDLTIFIHGYKGSFLREGETRAWLTPAEVLVPGERTLALPFEGEKTSRHYGPLVPDGPFTRLTVFPRIAEEEAYLSWLNFASRTWPGFIPFTYDWRQDLRATVAQLASFIDGLVRERQGRARVNLVGHSMGGLITLYYLRYGGGSADRVTWAGARYVQRVVLAGVPFQGAPDIFDDFHRGTRTGLNRALLSPEALFTFASAFQLLPASDDFFIDRAGAVVPVAVDDPATWRQRGWGVFEDPSLRDDAAYVTQLERMLAARRELYAAIGDVAEPPPESLKSLVIIGHGRPTVERVRVTNEGFDFKQPFRADGDGSVVAARARPPKPLDYQLVETRAEHAVILNDRDVQAAIATFLR